MCTKILEGFKAEGFYVNALHYETRLYNIRKENAVISLKQTNNEIIVSSSPQQEQYIKLIILEQIVELKDFLESAGKLKNLNTIGTELLKKKKISF